MAREPGQLACDVCSKPISERDPVMFARGEMRHLVCHVLLTNGRALELQADAETTHGGVQVRPVRTRDVIDWARRLRGEKRKRRPPPSSPPKPDDPGGKP